MKKIVTFLFMLIPVVSLWGQGKLHYVYICQDNSVENPRLSSTLEQFMQSHQGDNFVIYYSNVTPIVMDRTNYREDNIQSEIVKHNSSVSIMPLREIDRMSETLENYNYSRVDMHCFIGSQFFESGYHNSVIARFLLVNRLNDGEKINLVYHVCGSLQNGVDIDFAERYSINVQPTISQQ